MSSLKIDKYPKLKNLYRPGLSQKSHSLDWVCANLGDTSITNLDLRDTHVGGLRPSENRDRLAEHFQKATHLKELCLPENLTDRDLALLADLVDVETLNLSGSAITGDGLASLANLKSLRYLNISRTAIRDDELSKLPPLPNLERLNIGGNLINPDSLATLTIEKYPLLRNLDLDSSASVTDAWIPPILCIKQVTHVNLYFTRITDAGLMQLAKHELLHFLAFGLSHATANGKKEFLRLRPDVEIDSGD